MMKTAMTSPTNDDERYRRARRRVGVLRGFYIHALVYVLVNVALIGLNSMLPQGGWWSVWPLLGWGIGLAAHGASVFAAPNFFGRDWEERKIRELLAREAAI
jgi:hypothetical protein